eukprot:g19122.t1
MSIACFVVLSLLYVYIDRSDRGQGQEGQDLKTISGIDSGFAYFRVVFGVCKLSGLFPGHRRSSSLILRLDILKSVYLLVFTMPSRVYSIARKSLTLGGDHVVCETITECITSAFST